MVYNILFLKKNFIPIVHPEYLKSLFIVLLFFHFLKNMLKSLFECIQNICYFMNVSTDSLQKKVQH